MPPRVVDGADGLKGLVGREAGVSDWFEVTQDRVSAFAEVTEDRQWIHVDGERARAESPYGATVAHGFLTLALVSHLHHQAVQIEGFTRSINYGLNRVRFPAPVRAGSRVRTRNALQAVEEVPDGLQLTWLVTAEVEGEAKPALVAEWIVRLYR